MLDSSQRRKTVMGRHAERAGLGVAVALAHGLVLLALGQAVLPRLRDLPLPTLRAPMAVRLIEVLTAAPILMPNTNTEVATAPGRMLRQTREAMADPRANPQPQPRAINAEPAAAEAGPMASSATPASAPMAAVEHAGGEPGPPRLADAASAPKLPPMREQMLNDPRSNSPRATVGTRIAAVAGTTDRVEAEMDDTRRRVRQNGRCIEVHVSRNAQIDPWNQNARPTPKLVKPSCD